MKLLELTAGQVVTHADTPLGFRHGPKAVLDDRTLAVNYGIAVAAEDAHDHDVWLLPGLEGMADVILSLCFVLVVQTIALHASLALWP